MKNILKTLVFATIATVALFIGQGIVSAATIDVINGEDASGNDYGIITTQINSCTLTAPDNSSSDIITIASGKELVVETEEGCTQTFKITVKEGWEIESVLMDRINTPISSDNTYTFTNITGDHSICVKYKKIGTPNSPNTGDSAYVLPLVATTIISFGAILFVMKKRRSVKA